MRRSALLVAALAAAVLAAAVSVAGAKRRHRGHLPIDVDPDNVNGGGGSVISGGEHGAADQGRNKKASGECDLWRTVKGTDLSCSSCCNARQMNTCGYISRVSVLSVYLSVDAVLGCDSIQSQCPNN